MWPLPPATQRLCYQAMMLRGTCVGPCDHVASGVSSLSDCVAYKSFEGSGPWHELPGP